MATKKSETLKEAKEAGFHELRKYEYSGDQLQIKGHTLVKDPEIAVSQTEWGRRGFKVKPEEIRNPLSRIRGGVGNGKVIEWCVYRKDQVIPKKPTPAVKEPVLVTILAAVWGINRAAKRNRDAAQNYYQAGKHGFAGHAKETKEYYYNLKSQTIEHLAKEGILIPSGFHQFPGELWAEILCGEGYSFHRPCPPPKNPQGTDLSLDRIEAKPRTAREPRLKDAIFTIEAYLSEKGRVDIYSWPERTRNRRWHDWDEDDSNDEDDEDEYGA